MDLKITSESLEAAHKALDAHLRKFGFSRDSVAGAMYAAIDALCVPVEPEGWVKTLQWPMEFANNDYLLTYFSEKVSNYNCWRLYGKDGCPVSNAPASLIACEAQAWADRCIAELEAGEKKQEPFGPGSRYRAKNGDEWIVVTSEGGGPYGVVNLTKADFIKMGKWWFKMLDELRLALEAAGAVVIGGRMR